MEIMHYFAAGILLIAVMGLSGLKKALKRYSANLSQDPVSNH